MPQRYTFPLKAVFEEKHDVFTAPAVYIARDGSGHVQYVGQTEQGVRSRWLHHKYDSPTTTKKTRPLYGILQGDVDTSDWTLEVIVYRVRKARRYLLATERRLIAELTPKLNWRP